MLVDGPASASTEPKIRLAPGLIAESAKTGIKVVACLRLFVNGKFEDLGGYVHQWEHFSVRPGPQA